MTEPNLKAVDDASADPFDPESLRVSSIADVDVTRVMTTVPIRRPSRTEFFRVHPEFVMDTLMLEYDDGQDREFYLVRPNVQFLLADHLRHVRLFTCISKRGAVFLWPAKLPQDDRGRTWAESALMAAEAAKALWVKLVGRREIGAYEYLKAKGDLGDPQWPDKTHRDLLELAFRDRDIDREDHPVILDLNGEL
jgi:hypothetical protein